MEKEMKTNVVPVIVVEPIENSVNEISGTAYYDDELIFDGGIDEFISEIRNVINNRTSMILYRQDVRVFADSIQDCENTSKSTFKLIKERLRSEFTVLKLKYNPRTQEFSGLKTAFILHKR